MHKRIADRTVLPPDVAETRRRMGYSAIRTRHEVAQRDELIAALRDRTTDRERAIRCVSALAGVGERKVRHCLDDGLATDETWRLVDAVLRMHGREDLRRK